MKRSTTYQQAARYAPQDTALIERIASMRSKLVRDHVEAAERDALAGHADVATEELAKALLIDPGEHHRRRAIEPDEGDEG